jgi:hypothetical protein
MLCANIVILYGTSNLSFDVALWFIIYVSQWYFHQQSDIFIAFYDQICIIDCLHHHFDVLFMDNVIRAVI